MAYFWHVDHIYTATLSCDFCEDKTAVLVTAVSQKQMYQKIHEQGWKTYGMSKAKCPRCVAKCKPGNHRSNRNISS